MDGWKQTNNASKPSLSCHSCPYLTLSLRHGLGLSKQFATRSIYPLPDLVTDDQHAHSTIWAGRASKDC